MERTMHMKKTLFALMATTLLSACAVGPDFLFPASNAPDAWVSIAHDEKATAEQDWWKHFNDPVLDQLIAKAVENNLDLKVAQSRILAARAARQNAGNDLLPTVNVTGSAERQANRLAIGDAPFNLSKPFNVFQTGFDASWEFDLFGGKRRALEAANADLQAAQANADAVRVSLLAEVARTYVDIRQYQVQLTITQQTIDAEDKTAKIAKERFKVGDTAELDVTLADAQVQQARAQLPYYQNLALQAQFSMDVLLGEKPGATQAIVSAMQPIPVGDKALVLTAPAKVIAERPDIREAGAQLASATASQGVAVAKFFPDISLSGFLGFLSADAGDVLRTGSKSWDLGGNVLWPILNYGKLSANLKAADAQQQQALALYQKSVIAALSDVEKSVTAYTKEEEHRVALLKAAELNQHSVKIARERYKEGLSSFIEVLDAERSLYSSQAQAAASQAATSQNLIAVYKSLGGGWQDVPKPAAPEAKPATEATKK